MSTGQTVTNPEPQSFRHAHEVIRDAEQELTELLRQRIALMRRIGTVKQTLVCLAYALGDEALTPDILRLLGRGATRKQPGFTRACRVILMEAGIPLDARRGLQELHVRFPHLVDHLKAPLASVTTVFNRLVAYGEVRTFPNGKGRRVWEWIADSGTSADTAVTSDSGHELAQPATSITSSVE